MFLTAARNSKTLLEFAYHLYQESPSGTVALLGIAALAVLVQAYCAYVGNGWLGESLARKGYTSASGIVAAPNREDAIQSWHEHSLSSPVSETALPGSVSLWWKGTVLVVLWSLLVLWENGGGVLWRGHPNLPHPSQLMAEEMSPESLLHVIRHSPDLQHRKEALHDLRVGAGLAMPGDEARWGVIRFYGQYGVVKNEKSGLHWLRVSATAGDALGLEQMGMLAAKGLIPGGFPAAQLWFTHAAREGSLNAIEYIGYWPWHLLEHLAYHSPPALQRLHAGARSGNPVAEYYYAMSFRRGHPQADLPMPERQRNAVYWYQKSAEQGFAYAEYEMGQSAYIGRGGITKNMRVADHWWRLAALQGNDLAANNLGYSYQIGAGVPQNDILAAAWFLSSSADGYAPARAKANRLMANMTQEQKAQVLRYCTSFESPLEIMHGPKK